MSRYIVSLHGKDATDPEAIIGYDPPLRTFFAQGFPIEDEESYEELGLWLGVRMGEFPSLESLIERLRADGFRVQGLSRQTIIALLSEAGQPHSPSIGEQLRLLF